MRVFEQELDLGAQIFTLANNEEFEILPMKSTNLPAGIKFRTGLLLSCLLMGQIAVSPSAVAQSATAQSIVANTHAEADEIHDLAIRGDVYLIDIRDPSEWKQTGIGKSAHPISMHRNGFLAKLDALLQGDRSKPVALICARGNRSSHVKAQLNKIGFSNVINVREGMFGSRYGPGWLKRNLPTKKY